MLQKSYPQHRGLPMSLLRIMIAVAAVSTAGCFTPEKPSPDQYIFTIWTGAGGTRLVNYYTEPPSRGMLVGLALSTKWQDAYWQFSTPTKVEKPGQVQGRASGTVDCLSAFLMMSALLGRVENIDDVGRACSVQQ